MCVPALHSIQEGVCVWVCVCAVVVIVFVLIFCFVLTIMVLCLVPPDFVKAPHIHTALVHSIHPLTAHFCLILSEHLTYIQLLFIQYILWLPSSAWSCQNTSHTYSSCSFNTSFDCPVPPDFVRTPHIHTALAHSIHLLTAQFRLILSEHLTYTYSSCSFNTSFDFTSGMYVFSDLQ